MVDIFKDARERAGQVHSHPERLQLMREVWLASVAIMAPIPPIPPDATGSPGYSSKDIAQR